MVAECVAIKPSVIEIVQTVEIMLCKLVMSELVVSQLVVAKLIVGERVVTEIMGSEMTAAAHGVSRKAARAQCMAAPPMTHVGPATVGSTMKPAEPSVPATTPTAMSATTPMPAAAPMGEC